MRAPALVCPPETGVQDAARRMVEAGATCVLVDLGERLGIVTDRDLRTRVVADGAGPGHAALGGDERAGLDRRAPTAPAPRRCSRCSTTASATCPCWDPDGALLGVLDDVDLMASERRAPFRLRAQIARGADAAEVAAAAARAARRR